MAVLLGCAGCDALFDRSVLGYGHDSYAADLRAESLSVVASRDTTYQRRMWDFRRRAAAIDTDSLRLLYIALATVRDSQALTMRHRYLCYSTIGLMAHGQAFHRADARLRDSLRQHGGDLLRRAGSRIERNDSNDPGLSNGNCGGGFPENSIHDTLLYTPRLTALEAARRKNKAEVESLRALPRPRP